jgi:uncharacterized membrane-anchored protein
LADIWQAEIMSNSVVDWLEANADRAMSRQRSQADAAKLVATFVVGVAASTVASALQMNRSGSGTYNRWSSALLALSVILTVAVVVLDRISEADHKSILEEAQVRGWSEAKLLEELQVATITASQDNRKVVREIWCALLVQFICASLCGLFATLGMLGIKP